MTEEQRKPARHLRVVPGSGDCVVEGQGIIGVGLEMARQRRLRPAGVDIDHGAGDQGAAQHGYQEHSHTAAFTALNHARLPSTSATTRLTLPTAE